jgi:hypothetical protein
MVKVKKKIVVGVSESQAEHQRARMGRVSYAYSVRAGGADLRHRLRSMGTACAARAFRGWSV